MGLHPSRQGVHVLRHSPRPRSKLRRATYTRTGNRSRRLTCKCTSREVRSCRSPPRLRAHGHRAQARTSCPTGKHTIPSRQYFAGKYHPSLPEDRRESRVLDSFRKTDQCLDKGHSLHRSVKRVTTHGLPSARQAYYQRRYDLRNPANPHHCSH